MKSTHIPQHVVLKLTMDERDQLLNILAGGNTEFIMRMKTALFIDRDIELEENRFLP